jgi:hypothetical protein
MKYEIKLLSIIAKKETQDLQKELKNTMTKEEDEVYNFFKGEQWESNQLATKD